MKIALMLFVSLHGLIHLMGFAKAFGYAELPQLTIPISKPVGLLWLLAAVLLLLTAAAMAAFPRSWWTLAIPSVLLSQGVIVASWNDAKYGTIANLVIVLFAVLSQVSTGATRASSG